MFEKGYLLNWTNEVLTIREVAKTWPVTYKLKDALGKNLEGRFFGEKMQKTKIPDYFLIKKVIKKKTVHGRTRYFVKW